MSRDEAGVISVRTLLWRRLDRPGHEAARLVWHQPFWQLSGTAVWSHDGTVCRHIQYQLLERVEVSYRKGAEPFGRSLRRMQT